MTKLNITKPTGVEALNLLSAFKVENNTYVVFDSEKMGSMGLPIIYVSKFADKLEKINDANEWQSVKNYLKGIISGTNFEYIKMGDNLVADEVYYTPLTLPQSSFEAIKMRYKVEDVVTMEKATLTPNNMEVSPVMPDKSAVSNASINVSPAPAAINPAPVSNNPSFQTSFEVPIKQEPVNVNTVSNLDVPTNVDVKEDIPQSSSSKMNFDNDKELFLKACENMFDALISKYQKELESLSQKEQQLAMKEEEINAKLKDANEYLANAEAREQVANIAHDNAKKVMDLNSFMPVNPNSGN